MTPQLFREEIDVAEKAIENQRQKLAEYYGEEDNPTFIREERTKWEKKPNSVASTLSNFFTNEYRANRVKDTKLELIDRQICAVGISH